MVSLSIYFFVYFLTFSPIEEPIFCKQGGKKYSIKSHTRTLRSVGGSTPVWPVPFLIQTLYWTGTPLKNILKTKKMLPFLLHIQYSKICQRQKNVSYWCYFIYSAELFTFIFNLRPRIPTRNFCSVFAAFFLYVYLIVTPSVHSLVLRPFRRFLKFA